MTFTLAFRNLFHDRVRLAVTLIGILFSIVLIAVQLGLYLGARTMIIQTIVFYVLAAVTVSNAIHDGPTALDRLCREVAGRVDRAGTIEIVTETHDTVALLQDDALPLQVRVHERCEASP